MSNPFFDHPILNSPYGIPACHWELDVQGQPTQKVEPSRRPAQFITPIPKPKKRKGSERQEEIVFDEGAGLSTKDQRYETISIINEVRDAVARWRSQPASAWHVTPETEGQMLQRVLPDLMGLKNILVLNDEAHHCYREKPPEEDDEDLKGEERKEAEKNNEAARLWISGLEAVNRKLGLARVLDLSATPFFLRGSGYAEGVLFPWTMSDFSLMDAIECGIVKLPRVPVAENIPGDELPMFRNLWEHIRKDMPKKGRGQDQIACWFLDTDYDEESFFVRHAYFLGANDPYGSLKTTLKAEIDQGAWASLHQDTSRSFPKPSKGRIAVKVINHLGDEVMKVFKV